MLFLDLFLDDFQFVLDLLQLVDKVRAIFNRKIAAPDQIINAHMEKVCQPDQGAHIRLGLAGFVVGQCFLINARRAGNIDLPQIQVLS